MERTLIELSKEQIPFNIDIPKEGRLLLAFSGGSDSLFLMALLAQYAKGRSEALYVDHGIRDRLELDKEIALNMHNAVKLGINLNIEKIPTNKVFEYASDRKCGIEAAARALRYDILQKHAKENGFDFILTAHHREDQVETVLMRMLQGSPFYTYQGIVPEEGNIRRPILKVPKRFISRFIEDSNLEYSEDSTNGDTKYKRNNIRINIMPAISEGARESISKIAQNIYIYRKTHKDIDIRLSKYVSIDIDEFLASSTIQRERAIYSAAYYLGNPDRLSRRFIDAISSIASSRHGELHTSFLEFIASKDSLRIFKASSEFSFEYDPSLVNIGDFKLSHESSDSKTLLIDTSLFSGNAIIRKSRNGDRIKLKEGTKKVSELEKRAYAPYSIVLEDEDGIIAVFLRQFGGHDRLALRFLTGEGIPFSIA